MSSRGGLDKGRDPCFEIVSKFSRKIQGRVPGLWVLGLWIRKAIKDSGPECRPSGFINTSSSAFWLCGLKTLAGPGLSFLTCKMGAINIPTHMVIQSPMEQGLARLLTTVTPEPSTVPGLSQVFGKYCWMNVAKANIHVRCLAHNLHYPCISCSSCQF